MKTIILNLSASYSWEVLLKLIKIDSNWKRLFLQNLRVLFMKIIQLFIGILITIFNDKIIEDLIFDKYLLLFCCRKKMKIFILTSFKYTFKLSFMFLLIYQLIESTFEFLKFPTEVKFDLSEENATDLPSTSMCLKRSDVSRLN